MPKPSCTPRIDAYSGGGGAAASGEGTTEIILGILMTLAGIASVVIEEIPIYCCGFLIFGPILFFVGLFKAVRTPARPPTYYPGYGGPVPYYAPPHGPRGTSPPPTAPMPPAAPGAPVRKCGTCGSDNRGDAKFCTSCGVPI